MIRKTFDLISNYYAKRGNIRKAHRIEDLGREVESIILKNKEFILDALVFTIIFLFFFLFGIQFLEMLAYMLGIEP